MNWYDNYVKGQGERILYDLKIFKRFVKPETEYVCEIGGFPYYFTRLIKQYLFNKTVLSVIDKMSANYKKDDFTVCYYSVDVEKEPLPFMDKSQEVVVLSEVFEHLANPIFVASEIERVLKKGGVLILTTPNLYKLENYAGYILGRGFKFGSYAELHREYELGYKGHVREYTRRELCEFFSLNIINYRKVTFKSKNNLFFYFIKKVVPFLREHQVLVMRK